MVIREVGWYGLAIEEGWYDIVSLADKIIEMDKADQLQQWYGEDDAWHDMI